MTNENQAGRIHIDSDWKEEAAREKERLAEKEASAASGDPRGVGGEPAPGLLDIINVLAMQAAVSLGGFQGPGGESIPPNLAAAKHHIDLLAVLEAKTKGNLTEEEKKILGAVLYELRMQYVHMVHGPMPDAPAPKAP